MCEGLLREAELEIYEDNGIYIRMLAEIVDGMVILLSSSVKRSGKQGRSFKRKKANSMPVSKESKAEDPGIYRSVILHSVPENCGAHCVEIHFQACEGQESN